jgi:pilus assembly protein FimV
MRAIWLGLGGIITALLARPLRKIYLRRKPSITELATTIDAPPKKDDALKLADASCSTKPRKTCAEYLLSLLADYRDGRRDGFPLQVVEEIVLLLAMLRPD